MSLNNSNANSAMLPMAMPPPMTTVAPRWIVAQIGAREHYAIARGAHANGRLDCLYTDVWCRYGHKLLARGPRPCRALAGRWHVSLRQAQVHTLGLGVAIGLTLVGRTHDNQQLHQNFIGASQRFTRALNAALSRRILQPEHHVFIGYNTASLETLQVLRARGITALIDQIDPAQTEAALVAQEHDRWPGWQPRFGGAIPAEYWERIREEWRVADAIVVNSRWTKQALTTQGVPTDKIHIVPLAYEPPHNEVNGSIRRVAGRQGPLTVLFLGQVNLRKGIPYLLAAAARLPKDIEVIVAGPIAIAAEKISAAPANVRFIGTVSRGEVSRYMDQADLFVLPTISDGFAITQLEAMACGLPVIATSNCAEVVTDRVDGRVVPPGDVDALTDALADIAGNPGMLEEYSAAALRTVTRYSLERMSAALDTVARQVTARRYLEQREAKESRY